MPWLLTMTLAHPGRSPCPWHQWHLSDLRFCWEALPHSVHSCRHSSISRASCRRQICCRLTPNPNPMSSRINSASRTPRLKSGFLEGVFFFNEPEKRIYHLAIFLSYLRMISGSAKAAAECQSIEIQSKHLPQSQSKLSVSES